MGPHCISCILANTAQHNTMLYFCCINITLAISCVALLWPMIHTCHNFGANTGGKDLTTSNTEFCTIYPISLRSFAPGRPGARSCELVATRGRVHGPLGGPNRRRFGSRRVDVFGAGNRQRSHVCGCVTFVRCRCGARDGRAAQLGDLESHYRYTHLLITLCVLARRRPPSAPPPTKTLLS